MDNELIPISVGFDTAILAGTISGSSQEMYKRDFMAYLVYASSPENALDASTLARWRAHLVNTTKMSPNTINRMITAVKRMMEEAAIQKYITYEVADEFKRIHGVKADSMKSRMRVRNRVKIEPETMRALLDAIDTSTLVGLRNKALFTTLASSGLRATELVKLTPEQIIKRDKGYLLNMYAEIGKNQKEDREANISPEAVEAINVWLEARTVNSKYIFNSFQGRGSRLTANHITAMGAWKIAKKITDQVGIKDAKLHDFRRYIGTQLAKKDIRKAQKALGHKNIETTAKYDLNEIEVGQTDNLH